MTEEELTLDEKAFNYAKAKSEGTVAVTENYLLGELKLAYLDGFHEGKQKWHKVADKIPMNEGWVCNQDGLPCWYDLKNEQWLGCEGATVRVTEWCDMPHLRRW